MGAAVENIFNIITYSFIGWIIENTYCYCTEARFQNDGFLYGPYKPMYGIAMALLIVFEEIFDHKILIIVLCLAIPTMVEYLSGFILKGFFDKVYWDYSGMKFNLNGYICLKFSIYWMILSFIGIYLVHPLIKLIFLSYIRFFFVLIPFIALWFVLDLFFTVTMEDKKNLLSIIFSRMKI